MARFLVRVYCPYCSVMVEEVIEERSVGDARRKAIGEVFVCMICGRHFEVEEEFIIHVAPVVVVPPVEVNLRYAEVSFKERAEGDAYARSIEMRATEGPFDYVFRLKGKIVRATVYKSFDPLLIEPTFDEAVYWIIKRARVEPFVRVWHVRMANFALCAVMDGRRALETLRMPEGYTYNGEDLSGRLLQLCRYHSISTLLTIKIKATLIMLEVEGKAAPRAPNGLCIEYCPQAWVRRVYEYVEATKSMEYVLKARCMLWRGVKMKGKRYGMTILCFQDPWWAYYLGKKK